MKHNVMDRELKSEIAFRDFDMEKDFSRIYKWMHQPYVIPFWQLNLSKENLKSHMSEARIDPHQSLYIGSINGDPMSYWEAYWVQGDVVEKYYEADPFDQGIHLLIGEADYLGRGLALPLLRAMVDFQFKWKQTKKVIAEPDHRNEKMIHVFEKCGFKKIKKIELPDKTALLMFCEREEFEKRWKNDATHL
ncbi:rhizobactin siderophore biosynthesis protein RhbD [Halobacillus andaensis]|uniref:Lysine N-acyltransferase MbtK n=1 Tax=Halobacillus andaensis TaxID=1176239 RepID=A0A917EYX4_HALAA|nr:GNAT family N-acetyltransferase [Halobacillus andaensis]MBP2005511.1 RimJ/RimL family protein N-acetyltransferase [Halobacillus andaensis]GGF32065.1 rhizobactin siderophore biosynthesis protein RhbD [Halobacillus andaensis]